MTPARLLIAQRLEEVARELRCIAALMDEFKNDPAWLEVEKELRGTAQTADWWANEVRAER
jgi:hypothetical protein